MLLGEASGDLADIDLDCAQAIAAAPAFLPRTRTFGRTSKRFSHWLYKADLAATEDVATIKFQDAQKPAKIILEARIGGGKAAQTVFPGSVHPTGEAIEWEEQRVVATIDDGELKRICARLAACALLAWCARRRILPRRFPRAATLLACREGVFRRAGYKKVR